MNRSSTPRAPGRPRASLDAKVFSATLRTVHELGYARATVDRIAAEAGVAKTTVYRRWPSKGALITACLVDAFGPLQLTGKNREEDLETAIRWGARQVATPGIGAAFAGVFTDAVNDPALRTILVTELQDPYRQALEEVLDEGHQRVLFMVDVVIGALLHRMGISGAPMVDEDVDLLVEMVKPLLSKQRRRADHCDGAAR